MTLFELYWIFSFLFCIGFRKTTDTNITYVHAPLAMPMILGELVRKFFESLKNKGETSEEK